MYYNFIALKYVLLLIQHQIMQSVYTCRDITLKHFTYVFFMRYIDKLYLYLVLI